MEMSIGNLALATQTPQDLYARIMGGCQGHPVEDTLARMLASWLAGYGDMPDWLGLGEVRFGQMLDRHFPNWDCAELVNPGKPADLDRADEMVDLRKLLLQNRTHGTETEAWMADIVIAGCLGNDHLWQDLGLWSRKDLRKLMFDNFQPLAERNVKDMKWKKFLYKQLCETEGIYTCRAPSCEVCTDYQNCFGPEE